MVGLPERLVELLEGDGIRVEGPEVTVEAEVVGHRRDSVGSAGHDLDRKHMIRLLPVGEHATELAPDRFRITVEPVGTDDIIAAPAITAATASKPTPGLNLYRSPLASSTPGESSVANPVAIAVPLPAADTILV